RRNACTSARPTATCRADRSPAPPQARWAGSRPTPRPWPVGGYQLYGARAVPAQTAQMMTTAPTPEEIFPQIQYGLGTMIFSTLQLHVMPSVGHTGNDPESSTMLAVIPESHLRSHCSSPTRTKTPTASCGSSSPPFAESTDRMRTLAAL